MIRESEAPSALVAQARAEGYSAGRDGARVKLCPYPFGTKRSRAWIEGWLDGVSARAAALRQVHELGKRYRPTRATRSHDQITAAEAQAEADEDPSASRGRRVA